jgi:hypothetical protein
VVNMLKTEAQKCYLVGSSRREEEVLLSVMSAYNQSTFCHVL